MAKESQEEEQYGTVSRYEGPQPTAETIEVILEPQYMLEYIRHRLNNEILVGKGRDRCWEKNIKAKAKMNEAGVEDLMNFLDPIFGIPQSLSNISDKEFRLEIMKHLFAIRKWIFFHATEYEIEEGDYDQVYNLISTNLLLMLSKSRKGWQGDLVKGIFGVREVKSIKSSSALEENSPQKSGGFMNWFRR